MNNKQWCTDEQVEEMAVCLDACGRLQAAKIMRSLLAERQSQPVRGGGVSDELCEDEGCPHHGMEHVCVAGVSQEEVTAAINAYEAMEKKAFDGTFRRNPITLEDCMRAALENFIAGRDGE